MIRLFLLAAVAAAITVTPADANLTISPNATRHVDCSNGVCTATAAHANLNHVQMLQMLNSGDVTVISGNEAQDIQVEANLAWGSVHRLTLDSFRSIAINHPVAVNGSGSLTLTTNDGGTGGSLSFAKRASVHFLGMGDRLIINGTTYTVVPDIATLAADVPANLNGHFALANDYDAGPDGTYTQDPVSVFAGTFEGLNNTIKNLRIDNADRGVHVGLFYEAGTVTHVHLAKAHIKATGTNASVGILAGACGAITDVTVSGAVSGAPGSFVGGACGVLSGNMSGASSSGTITGNGNGASAQDALGGLVGLLDGGVISNSFSSAKVVGADGWTAGGLVGETENSTYRITDSFATGVVSVGDDGVAGGLVGNNAGLHAIDNSHAIGFVVGGVNSSVGGFIGINNGPVSDSYSSGAVASGSGNAVGGFIGADLGASDLTDTYWDTTTSGQSHGVGNNTNYPGITGLTTEQFQAGLPGGFDSAIWAEDPSVNGGLPYLRAVPPK